MGDIYIIPKEPISIKHEALKRANNKQWSFINRNSTISIFSLSAGFLPKYLWEHWKPTLKSQGISWQLFLKAISACKYEVFAWVEGRRHWEELITIIIKVLKKVEKGIYPLWPP